MALVYLFPMFPSKIICCSDLSSAKHEHIYHLSLMWNGEGAASLIYGGPLDIVSFFSLVKLGFDITDEKLGSRFVDFVGQCPSRKKHVRMQHNE